MFNYNNIDNIQICMDVPFMDHPYLIGPRGRKCQHLMDRYRSLIHFPDSNRRVNGPKLNNVVINGSSKNAEELRSQIRSRTPVRLAVQLSEFANPASLCSRMESAIAEKSLPIRLNYTEDYKSAMLKTEWRNEETLIAFCNEFFYTEIYDLGATGGFDGTSGDNGGVFTMALTILPIVNPWNPELSAQLIEHIHSVTDCWVLYPPKEKFCEQPPSYFIKGTSAAGVLKAGKFMMGLTMFQVSFIVPNTVQLNLEHSEEWQRELLVHTTIEPVFGTNAGNEVGGGAVEFLHNRAILRSFEFCLNNIYFVRSLLLGFKKTVQSAHYNFMNDVKRAIPCSVFSTGQLYFPLYAIDNERSFDFETAGKDFFQKFYGGPYTLTGVPGIIQPSPPSPITENCVNVDLASRLKCLLNIAPAKNNNNNGAADGVGNFKSRDFDKLKNDSNASEELEIVRHSSTLSDEKCSPSSREKVENQLLTDTPPAPNASESMVTTGFGNSPTFALTTTVTNTYVPFHQSTPVAKPASGKGEKPSIIFSNCYVSATSPSTVDHEDDVELQAILRRTMPCLQVTQDQVNAMDHERISRALITADSLAMFTNTQSHPFLHSEYAVSYPANVSASEFENQFAEFLKMRNCYFKIRRIKATKMANDHNNFSAVNDDSNNLVFDVRPDDTTTPKHGAVSLRRTASF